MNADERRKLLDRYELAKRRLDLLREEQAAKGMNTPPEIIIEIEKIENELSEWDKVLNKANGKIPNLEDIGFTDMSMNERFQMIMRLFLLYQEQLKEALEQVHQAQKQAHEHLLKTIQPDIHRSIQKHFVWLALFQVILMTVLVAVAFVVRL